MVTVYGVNIDPDRPATGVIANNNVPGLWDELDQQCIDLAWEEYCRVRDARIAELGNMLETLDAELEGVSDEEHDRIQERNQGRRKAWESETRKLENDECTADISPPDERGMCLIGAWTKDPEDGKYMPDKKGSNGFAAIVGEIYSQVVWSKWVRRNRQHCSPCYPGQIDLDNEGPFIAFDFPPEFYEPMGESDEPRPEIEEWREPTTR